MFVNDEPCPTCGHHKCMCEYPAEPQTFEGDVVSLLRVINKVLPTIQNHPLYAQLKEATENVSEWNQESDPIRMGWVGKDGLP